MTTHQDVIVIGSGAGGSAVAFRAARAGLRVLLLEKGGPLPRDGSTLDVETVVGRGAFKSREPWVDGRGRTIAPEEYFNLGGKTRWYGAALLRFAPEEFRPDPAHDCLGWPFGPEGLEPYYAQAESLLGVRAFPPEPRLRALVARLTANGAGWRAAPVPLALAPEIVEHPEEARRFDGFASVKGLKGDAAGSLLARVAGNPNLRISSGQAVRTLHLRAGDGGFRVAGVECEDGTVHGATHVVLAAGAMHSPRILSRALGENGLATRLPAARNVGRNFKLHLLTAMVGFGAAGNADLLRKTLLFVNERYPHSSVQPLGFDADLLGALIPRFVPRPVARALGARAYGFFLQTEDGSHPENRVVGAANGVDLPRLDYDAARVPEARAEHRGLVSGFRRALLKAGMPSGVQSIPVTGTAHACGTLVTGADPARSVVDADGRVHGVANLWVADGSVLPRSSRVNPALTIYAWGLRLGERLAREVRR